MDFKDFESTKDDEAVEVQFTIPTFPGQKSDNSPKIHMASLMFLSFLQLTLSDEKWPRIRPPSSPRLSCYDQGRLSSKPGVLYDSVYFLGVK